MKKKYAGVIFVIHAAVFGAGKRGEMLLRWVLLPMPEVQVVAVCDPIGERAAAAAALVREFGGEAKAFTDWKEALDQPGLDAVFIFTGWEMHAKIAVCAMRKGIAVASEVGCEYSLENCFELVRCHEQTGTPYMFMENCCYDRAELLTTAMARRGLFGTIVHCEGAYGHDLREEVAYGLIRGHYRFKNYENRCCENYPTHELGPIARLLNINRGNRILTVSATASKAAGLTEYIAARSPELDAYRDVRFLQGDIVDTMITCAGGETIHLRLDTTLPRFYSRNFTVRGTKGSYFGAANAVLLDGDPIAEGFESATALQKLMNNAQEYEQEYLPKLWKSVTQEMMDAGHGGMDYFVYHAFVDALENHTPVPIDVYDGVTWMAVAVLSEQSLLLGGQPQVMPDFTGGQWYLRGPQDVTPL